MINTVDCKTIINFFQDVSISYENSTEKNLSSALKMASCFVLIAALYVGFRYVSSLVGRASQDSVDIETSIDEQLKELFKSKEKAQKCFFIDNPELGITNFKVGIIYNPRGNPIDMGNGKTEYYTVCIASHAMPPYEVTDFINTKVPQIRAFTVLGYRLGNDAFLGFD